MRHSLCIYGNMPNGLNQYHLGPVEMAGQGRHLHEIHSIDQRSSKRQQLQSCHRRGPNTVPAQRAEITKCHVIFVVFFKF